MVLCDLLRYHVTLEDVSLSLVPLVDFFGKVKENRMRKVLCVAVDEFLQPLVALFFIGLVKCGHL